ncbi:allophanate hydrolase [Clavibacter tessellarius]|uniref:allophanate hydrolase n=1 Tax=Clavibacter tessellarius TaxID=31965 RepID=UPI0039E9527F
MSRGIGVAGATTALPPVGSASVVDRVRAAYARIAEVDRPEVWITLLDPADALARAGELDARIARAPAGALPLAGWLVAVKDNIDVAGMPTTAACPSAATAPEVDAPAVARLREAGALVIGKTNLDQFATGLVGTRSPYGAVRHATRPDRISGGSSSGSAVAVALGLVDVALGTDTAGSGRVPAALHGLVGIKPTLGLVPTTGVVPACRSYDTVSVLSADLATAQRALAEMVGPDPADPASRDWPSTTRLAPRGVPVVGVPAEHDLAPLSPGARAAFHEAVERMRDSGAVVETVELGPFLRAALLLYEGALVAERCEAAGPSVLADAPDLDPTVAGIVRAALGIPAHRLVEDRALLERLRVAACAVFDAPGDARRGIDALLMPTTTEHPTLAEVAAEPVAVNARLGTYTNFVNLFDLCAVAVPAGEADGSPFGVSLVAPGFADQVVLDLAGRITGDPVRPALLPTDAVDVVVFGAHLGGQPLHRQLGELGARFSRDVRTSAAYRMAHLPGEPARPGVTPAPDGDGVPLAGEAWTLTRAGLAAFLAGMVRPMALGPVELEDGTQAIGFLCTDVAGAPDISAHGGWLRYLASGGQAVPVS